MRWSPISVILPLFLFTASTTAYPVSTADLRLDGAFDYPQESTIAKRAPSKCDQAKVVLRNAGRSECTAASRTHTTNTFDWRLVARLGKITSKTIEAFLKDPRNFDINLATSGALQNNPSLDGVSSCYPNQSEPH